MALHNELGRNGEDLAAEYLEKHGYFILHTNWRCGHKEVDIIAETKDELIIVEVKTRKSAYFGNPEDAVDRKKIQFLVSAANAYTRFYHIDKPVRFDIISVIIADGAIDIDHIEDAFTALPWSY